MKDKIKELRHPKKKEESKSLLLRGSEEESITEDKREIEIKQQQKR